MPVNRTTVFWALDQARILDKDQTEAAIKAVLDGLMEPSDEMLGEAGVGDAVVVFKHMIAAERARLFPNEGAE